MDQTVRGLEILDVELDELFTAQSTVVGERDHQPIAQRFRGAGGQNPLSNILIGDPGSLLDMPYETLAGSAAATACLPSADRVLLAQAVLHQVLVEGPDRDQALLDG
ncbi:hypothetical protein GCM10010095_72030 [Streptomyces anthocyanicus]|uniref:Uncharacterized protein n=1 Tax=Streptomyces violaceolatus TaxID=67378 RepID=A0ABN3TGS9_9ACTN|nr:hypothetical protein GCM10010095_72030 [Streptomyces anthocyanicus]GHC32949.1 hypothetical protein GCM10010348_69770 [Streptomyces anthocyanicus]